MCLDCDNVFATTFAQGVMRELRRSRADLCEFCPAVCAGSSELATTGRLAYWLTDFLFAGGYDQEGASEGRTAPSGYQDVDMGVRVRMNAEKYGKLTPQSRKRPWSVPVALGAGFAFPNSEQAGEDRGWAKVRNAHPELLKKFNWKWGNMNTHNVAVMTAKRTERGHGIRNVAKTDQEIYMWTLAPPQERLARLRRLILPPLPALNASTLPGASPPKAMATSTSSTSVPAPPPVKAWPPVKAAPATPVPLAESKPATAAPQPAPAVKAQPGKAPKVPPPVKAPPASRDFGDPVSAQRPKAAAASSSTDVLVKANLLVG